MSGRSFTDWFKRPVDALNRRRRRRREREEEREREERRQREREERETIEEWDRMMAQIEAKPEGSDG